MTIAEWLKQATDRLSQRGDPTARLDCLLLLEDALSLNRAHILAHDDRELSLATVSSLATLIIRREQAEPMAYIRGRTEFYTRTFRINSQVLVPRPESEAIIELLKNSVSSKSAQLKIADVGCGSGCLGITASCELALDTVDFYDIDKAALAVAQQNAQDHQVMGTFIHSDLFATALAQYDVVLANLPYVPTDYPINTAARHEPAHALFGGSDGLSLYRRLFARPHLTRGGIIITESLPDQHTLLTALGREHDLALVQTMGYAQLFKLDD
jgi:release factor glutamine methyltransferase